MFVTVGGETMPVPETDRELVPLDALELTVIVPL
jgi:hypothetical protein